MGKNTLILALWAIGFASATARFDAQSIIVNPVESPLQVSVWTDKDTSGRALPSYKVGDKIWLYTRVTEDAYVYLFNVDPSRKIDMVLPNRLQGGGNLVRAGETKAFPSQNSKFFFTVDSQGGLGTNKVLALASKTPLDMNDIARFQNRTSQFADIQVSGQRGLAAALSIVVNPVPEDDWTTDTASYNVTGKYANQTGQTSPGRLIIQTNMNGADVFINGRRAGRGSITLSDLSAGTYQITVRAQGYQDYTVNVTLDGQQPVTITANF